MQNFNIFPLDEMSSDNNNGMKLFEFRLERLRKEFTLSTRMVNDWKEFPVLLTELRQVEPAAIKAILNSYNISAIKRSILIRVIAAINN